MGASASVPQRVYNAAKANDVAELQALCMDMRRSAADAATRSRTLNWTDGEGRNALQWAAQKNHLQAVQILLAEGADVHACAPNRPSGGTPLHEAVAAKHEALAAVLLAAGADPFTENAAGRTAHDLALESRSAVMVRALEGRALFGGYVNMKVLQLKGFSHAAKDRWVVIAPRFTPPPARSGGVGVVRLMLLAYRNAAEAEPRTRVWLDGANVFRSGQEAVLRLHPNHEQPRNAFSKFDGGWMLFFKPAQGALLPPPGAAGPASAAQAAGAPAATFAAFLSVCSRPLDHLLQQQQHAAQQQQQQQHQSVVADPFAGAPPPNPWQGQQQQQQQQQRPGAASAWQQSPAGGGSAPGRMRQQGGAAYLYGGQPYEVSAAGAPPAAAQAQGAPAAADTAAGLLDQSLALNALPGESDAAFAHRLAAMFSGGAAAVQQPGATTAAPARASSATTAQQQQQEAGGAGGGGGGLYPSLPGGQVDSRRTTASDPLSAASAPPVPAAGLPPASTNPFLHQAAAPPPPPAAPAVAAIAADAAAAAAVPAAAGATGSSDDGAGSDADCCVICLSNPREVGFLHGASVHKCVCKECAGMVRVGAPCPMCRQAIERIIGVY